MNKYKLPVRAVMQNRSGVPLGAVRMRSREDARGSDTLVSVVIPCCNQAHFLGEAIESVLAQSYGRFEVVVVDDGSTDNTAAVAARYPKARYIRQDNQGLARARNRGLHQSRGNYLVFLDADDRLLSNALEAGLECMKAYPECAFVSGHYRPIAADGSPLNLRWDQPCPVKEHYLEMLRENYIGMPAEVMYRRSVLESIGGFNTSVSVRGCEDYDLYLRIARTFSVYCHGTVVAEYRRHGASMSKNPVLMLRGTLSILRSQREYVRENKKYEEAIGRGIEAAQGSYGRRVAYKLTPHIAEVIRSSLPSDATVIVVGKGDSLQLRREGWKAWCFFPQTESTEPRAPFAEGSEGAADADWIWPNTIYEFRLYAGEGHARLLDTIAVTQSEGSLLTAGSNPAGGTGSRTTRLGWSTGDGSWGQVYVTLKHINFCYPADSFEAIVRLEELRTRGGEYLLFPNTAFWWFDHYPGFKQHLEGRYRLTAHYEDTCLIFDLRRPERNQHSLVQ
jgi:glycosyltransferase involved in cell wall biosynthesis